MADSESQAPIDAPQGVVMRCCVTCGEIKPETDFYFKDGTRIKRKESCKICVRIRVKKFYTENPDRFAKNTPEGKEASKKKWREEYWKNPDKYRKIALNSFYKRHESALAKQRENYHKDPAKYVALAAKWNKENPERVKAWAAANRERINLSQRKHRLNFPETGFISRANRRARKSSSPERLKAGIRERLMIEQKGLCPYCKADLNSGVKHLDHLIPLAKGGRHCNANMQLTCKPCNLRKQAKDPILFGREMGIFIPSTQLAI